MIISSQIMSLSTAERFPSVNRFPGNPHGPLTFEIIPEFFTQEPVKPSGITIETPHLEPIYELLLSQADILASGQGINDEWAKSMFTPNWVEDELIAIEGSSVGSVSGLVDIEEKAGYFDLSTNILLADSQSSREDHGYFGAQRVQAIRALLSNRGLPSSFEQSILYMNSINIPLSNTAVEVHFGYDSREAEEAGVYREVEQDKIRYGKPGKLTQEALERLQKGLVNNSLSLKLVNKDFDIYWGKGSSVMIGDFGRFTDQVDEYRRVVEVVLAALYEEAGLKVPGYVLRWEPFLGSTNSMHQTDYGEQSVSETGESPILPQYS